MDNKKEILSNEYFFSVITKMLLILVGVLRSVLIARYLGTSLKGEYSYIASLVGVFSIIVTFGMHQAYPYFRKKYGKDEIYKDYLSSISFLFLLYSVVAILLLLYTNVSFDIRASILLTPLYGYANVLTYVLLIENPNKRNKSHFIISIIELLIISYLFLFTTSNKYASVIILAIPNLLQVIYCAFILKPGFHINKRHLYLLWELAKFGFVPMLSLLMTTLNYKIDIIMLNRFPFIITASMIGIYSVGINITDYIALIPDTLKGVLVSRLAKGADEKEVAKVCRMCFFISFLICVLLFIIGNPIITLLYGSDYEYAYYIVSTCGIGSVFICFFKLIGQYNIVNKKQVRNLIMLSSSVVINVILNWCLIPRFKLIGAAIASCVGYSVTGIVFVMMFSRETRIPLKDLFLVNKTDINSFIRIGGNK